MIARMPDGQVRAEVYDRLTGGTREADLTPQQYVNEMAEWMYMKLANKASVRISWHKDLETDLKWPTVSHDNITYRYKHKEV